MIPNFYWATIPLGPIHFQVWGTFVALGILVAALVAKRVANQSGLKGDQIIDITFWIILAAFIGARVFFVITEWQSFVGHWGDILKLWQGGMSITGGFVGSIIAGYLYLRNKRLPFWPYAETIVYALPLGLAIGRLGCFFIFDHPGTVTNFILGEEYFIDHLVRHNHGLYLVLDNALLFGLFSWLRYRSKPQAPFFTMLFLLWDGIVRLLFDSNRILDSRYLGFTAAQWAGIGMIVGAIIIYQQRNRINFKIS